MILNSSYSVKIITINIRINIRILEYGVKILEKKNILHNVFREEI